MFTNGHKLLMDLALDALGCEALTQHYDALLLGNLREDVYKVPFLNRFFMGKGLTHYYRPGRRGGLVAFIPGAPFRTDYLFTRAVRCWREGKPRDGAYSLGRAVHLLGEMAAPVHAQAVLHWRGDPFEMYLEEHAGALRHTVRIGDVPTGIETAGALVHHLAVFCQQFPCDRTRNIPGWIGWKLGRHRRHTEEDLRRQLDALLPVGAAHVLALYELFLRTVGEGVPPRESGNSARSLD